ncbi:TetR/AcrR family transcriptional regulator [Actinomadura rudentiformis]|uniref:TetR/AcrR family transcriptional regulator n=1 Tax=Actinomadura rudentiformis TaxID=359158 RepID=A0A6H9Z4J4_9ACTN|nr:TetR/AcrR family transcriptional regulator [Actinomadura rudentiformis]KAB2352188.1 TetR/AcrR family transcriptional regulator [Actinomadura rudentiformis]
MADQGEVRQRIIDAATRLLQDQGREAVTTRAVSAAAGVQSPTLYRLFTDMNGLLEAVASEGFARYLADKHAQGLSADPVEDLRRGWDLHVEFGLRNSAQYLLMYGQPIPGHRHPAAEQGLQRLRMLIERIAAAGRLVVGVETAISMMHAACVGITMNLIETPHEERDPALADRLREAVLAAITKTVPDSPPAVAERAVALKAVLDDTAGLYSAGERALMNELLDRAADHTPTR